MLAGTSNAGSSECRAKGLRDRRVCQTRRERPLSAAKHQRRTARAHSADRFFDEASLTDSRHTLDQNCRTAFGRQVPDAAKERAVADVSAAATAGALAVGEDAGLPLHRFPLERAGDAHAAVEGGAVGKVLIDIEQRKGE